MKAFLRIVLSLAVAGALLGALALWGDVDPALLAQTWRRLPVATYLAALAVHAGIFLLRAVRFRVLMPPELRPPLARVVPISAAHTLAAYVLPAKTGEASLVVYLRALCGVPATDGTATLLAARLVDMATLSGFFAVASLLLAARGGPANRAGLLPLGLLLALVAVLFLVACARSDRLVRLVPRLARALRLDRTRPGAVLHARAEALAVSLARAGAGGRLPAALLISVPLWGGVFLFYAILARGLGLGDLGLAEATFGSALAVLTNMLPVNGFAGFGTQEAGWVVGFAWLGVGRDVALATGLGVHVVQLVNACLFGLLGHLAMGLGARSPARG
jgi:glycosyltransferase 2 family protein